MKIKFTPVTCIVNHTLLNNNNNNKKKPFFLYKVYKQQFLNVLTSAGISMSFGVGLLSQTDEVILSQLCSKAKTGQSSKALGKESTESNENQAEYSQSLPLHRSLSQQLNNPCLRLLSALPNKTSPSPPRLPTSQQNSQRGSGEREASRGTIKKFTHSFPMRIPVLSLSSPRGETFCEILTLLPGLHQTWSC